MLRVNELFYSIQGEGMHAGRPAVFIRLMGCPVGCAFCDTKHTWTIRNEQEVPADVILEDGPRDAQSWGWVGPRALLGWVAEKMPAGLVVITGGEPMLEPALASLVMLFSENGYEVQVETSGTIENAGITEIHREGLADLWLTVSPKWAGRLPVKQALLDDADELKIVVSSEEIRDKAEALLATAQKAIYLQPETGNNFKQSLAWVTELCLRYPARARLSVQMHTFLELR